VDKFPFCVEDAVGSRDTSQRFEDDVDYPDRKSECDVYTSESEGADEGTAADRAISLQEPVRVAIVVIEHVYYSGLDNSQNSLMRNVKNGLTAVGILK
jgi:hypothetical protein